jgi:hypothetical protein
MPLILRYPVSQQLEVFIVYTEGKVEYSDIVETLSPVKKISSFLKEPDTGIEAENDGLILPNKP